MPLNIEHVLTHPRAPLWTALTAPWIGIGVATFVLEQEIRGRRTTGFIQLSKRSARPEADLLCLAPATLPESESDADVATIWRQLLNHCAYSAASHGLQRIYASTPDRCPEQAYLWDGGFCLYARETIYRLAGVRPAGGSQAPRPGSSSTGRQMSKTTSLLKSRSETALAGFRPQCPQDSWALQRLYARDTPRLVQQAEGALSGPMGSPVFSWWEPDTWRGTVYEPAGEVRGVVQVHFGRAGHWLRLWGASQLSARELRSLLEQGLREIELALLQGQGRAAPIYATVRDYEIGVSGALTGFGFAPNTQRARFVKHTLSAARESMAATVPEHPICQEATARAQAAVHSLRSQTQSPTILSS